MNADGVCIARHWSVLVSTVRSHEGEKFGRATKGDGIPIEVDSAGDGPADTGGCEGVMAAHNPISRCSVIAFSMAIRGN